MTLLTGIVVDGRIEFDGKKLPDGTRVVVQPEAEAPALNHEQLELLRAADDACDRGEGVPAAEVFADLKRRRSS